MLGSPQLGEAIMTDQSSAWMRATPTLICVIDLTWLQLEEGA